MKQLVNAQKGQTGIQNTAIAFVILVVLVTIGASIIANLGTQFGADGTNLSDPSANTAAANASRTGVGGMLQMSGFFLIIGLVIAGAYVISILVSSFRGAQ